MNIKEEIIIQETINNISHQYPDKCKTWEKLIQGNIRFEKSIEVYEDMLSTFDFMFDLIKEIRNMKGVRR